MFGSGSPPKDGSESTAPGVVDGSSDVVVTPKAGDEAPGSSEKRAGNGSPSGDKSGNGEKKRRGSGVGGKASSLLASAKSSLHFSPSPNSSGFMRTAEPSQQTPLQKLGRADPALSVPQGQHNNSAGESLPGPRSTFTGTW